MLLCVIVPSFELAVARRDRPELRGAVMLADKFERGRVIAVDVGAHACGARVGQTVLQARAAANDAHVLVHDSQRTRIVWNDMLDALDALSPLVDDAAEGLAYAEMRGIAGDPAQWIAQARRILRDFNLPLHVAVAENKFVARVAALVADGAVWELGSERALLEPLAVDYLPIDAPLVERLRLLGVRTLGDLARLPHGPFVRRFGKAATVWHRCAQGIDPTPFLPRAHELQIGAALFGEGVAEQEEQVYFALRMLADRVCADLERLGKGVALLHVTFECENGETRLVPVGLAQATADARPILDVIRAKLEGQTFEAPVTGLRLQAMRLEECGAPVALFAGGNGDPQAVAVALARLEAAFGSPAMQPRLVPSHVFERGFVYDAFAPPQSLTLPAQPHELPAQTVPQLRLLAVREIDVRMTGNLPVFVGTPPQAVLDCTGPWRIEDGWFERAVVRDEYDVLLEGGALYRIYRQGDRWYLRGAYD